MAIAFAISPTSSLVADDAIAATSKLLTTFRSSSSSSSLSFSSSPSPFIADTNTTRKKNDVARRRAGIDSSSSLGGSGRDQLSSRGSVRAAASVVDRRRWAGRSVLRGAGGKRHLVPPFTIVKRDRRWLLDGYDDGGAGAWLGWGNAGGGSILRGGRLHPVAARVAIAGKDAESSAFERGKNIFVSPLSSSLAMLARFQRQGGNGTAHLEDRDLQAADIRRDCRRRSGSGRRPHTSSSLFTSILVRYSCLVCDWWVLQANLRERSRDMMSGSALLRRIMEVRGVFMRPRAWIAEWVGETARLDDSMSRGLKGSTEKVTSVEKDEGEEEEEGCRKSLGEVEDGENIDAMFEEEEGGEEFKKYGSRRRGWDASREEEEEEVEATWKHEKGRKKAAVDGMKTEERKQEAMEEEEGEEGKDFWIRERMAALMREVERRTKIQEYMRAGLIGWVTGERRQERGERGAEEEQQQLIVDEEMQELLERERRKKASPGAKIPGFSFSAAGLLFPYHLGATKCLMENGFITDDTFLSGSSAGALVCAVIVGGLTMEEALDATKRLAEDCRVNGTAFRLGAVLRQFLMEFLPDDAHEKATGRIQVAVTQVFRRPRSLLVDKFESKEDMIDALITSCFIPGYLAPRPVTLFRNRVCIDGGITAFMPPTASETTVRVCAFPTSSFGLKDDGISPDRNPVGRPSVSQLFAWALEPADDETLDQLFEWGYQDALSWVSEISPFVKSILPSDSSFERVS